MLRDPDLPPGHDPAGGPLRPPQGLFRRVRRVGAVVAVALALLAGGVWLGGHPEGLPTGVRDVLVGDEDTRVIDEALRTIADRYYAEVDPADLADDAIAGAVESLDDRFSAYFSPKEYRQFQEVQNSEFSGVGLVVSPHPSGLRVVEVYDGTPASRAKLAPADVIVAVEGRALKGVKQQAATDRIKGPPGTDVTITVSRDGKRRDYTLTRARVNVPVVASRIRTVDGVKVGIINLAQFSSGAHAEVYAAIRKVQKQGAKGLVFDLRRNGGGLVSEAQLIASAFLPDGPIVTTRGRSVPTRTLSATGDPVAEDIPLVVLVDGDTASASEIVAGALQDRDRAEVVGAKTFGKGVFQEVIELSNGGALDITAGQYFTPDGRNLGGKGVSQGAGITPDVKVKDDPKTKPDEALNRALSELRAKTTS
ncbi:S41 family peptidase [Paraconexibacter sp.]|uniref:S41 family peptidase n=1 Tax=Paraconexibacter sp. TaxID=2949640 RepID=UPI00356B4273